MSRTNRTCAFIWVKWGKPGYRVSLFNYKEVTHSDSTTFGDQGSDYAINSSGHIPNTSR